VLSGVWVWWVGFICAIAFSGWIGSEAKGETQYCGGAACGGSV